MIRKFTAKDLAKSSDLRRTPEYTKYVKRLINEEFLKIKNKLITDFNNHPVTVEIDAGVNASNTSDTLDGQGNLFTYIGFKEGDKPTNKIRDLFERSIFLSSIIFSRNGQFRVVIAYPKPHTVFQQTPLPWADGRSWAEGIERGLPGLGMYLHKDVPSSRSGKGTQATTKVRPGSFRNRSYITQLIREFEGQIAKLNQSTF